MTVDEVADLLRVPKKTIYQCWRDWKLPALKIGRDLRFPRDGIERWLQSRRLN